MLKILSSCIRRLGLYIGKGGNPSKANSKHWRPSIQEKGGVGKVSNLHIIIRSRRVDSGNEGKASQRGNTENTKKDRTKGR
ncbi:hypothetical protein NQ317_003040 [Molorchus minor]|uniref:Uncharacterized protein n=1 Tax=Molorchus minor TaxID=1323400 RepID=A0ABQ9JFQ2_9CUCU|nr:hypothetical protein NQ317_003040 [Molorchus minor]